MTVQHHGKHRVTNLSVEHPDVHRLFDDGARASILFSDPPWGDGNVGYWATKASKDTGEAVPRISYDTLMQSIFGLIRGHVSGFVFIETGPRWQKDIEDRMAAAKMHHVNSAALRYKSGSKWLENIIVVGSTDPARRFDVKVVEGMHGAAVAAKCVAGVARPGDIVFDPCCGMGYSAQAAVDAGLEFRGNELNRVRLAKTIKRLSK